VTTAGGGGFVDVKVSPSGALTVAATVNDGTDDISILSAGSDDLVNTENELVTASLGYVFDGTAWDRLRGDSTNGALVNLGTNNDVVVSSSITGIAHGVKTITSAGTDEALAGSTACKRVTIQAQTDNTGLIAVGTSGVDATEATGTGILLSAGDVFELDIDNLADVFIDATVTGDGVRYTYFT
jgi:hypothetical protein